MTRSRLNNRASSYVGDVRQGDVVDVFGDFLSGAVGSLGQSLSADGLQQTLRSLQ